MPDVLAAYAQVLAESRGPDQKNKIGLRNNCATMLAFLQGSDAPALVLDALLDYLKDNKAGRVYLGLKDGKETWGGDGRIVAIRALDRIGVKRVSARKDIVEQLAKVAAEPDVEADVRKEALKLHEQLKKAK
jgi:hypothetical protein